MQCCAGGNQSLRNIMVLGKKTVLQGEIVCVGWWEGRWQSFSLLHQAI